MFPSTIQKLIELFSKLPTIGPKTAARFVFYLLKKDEQEIKELLETIRDLKKKVGLCSFCFNPFEGEGNLCSICSNPKRDKKLLCIVEKEIDLEAIEKIKRYSGFYFILGGTILPLKKQGDVRIKELKERILNPEKFNIDADFEEIIIAVNPTTEGEATALYLERSLKPLKKKTTRLARGLPVGAELEYADEETLGDALERRI